MEKLFIFIFKWLNKIGIIKNIMLFINKIGIKKQLVHGSEFRIFINHTKKGDILLVQAFGEATSLLIGDDFTHAAIRVEGNKIIDATNKGVTENDIFNLFVGVSRICIKRPKLEEVKRNEIAERAKHYALQNIEYDYGFSIGKDEMYCSELAMICCNDVVLDYLETRERYGVQTITPSDIFLADKKFETIYDSGKK